MITSSIKRVFPSLHPIFSVDFFFSKIFMELLMEGKSYGWLFIKSNVDSVKMLCHVVFVSFFHCITKMITTHCLISRDLSDEVSWFLSSLSCSQLFLPDHKNHFVTNLLSKKYAWTKVFQENQRFGVQDFQSQRQITYPLW